MEKDKKPGKIIFVISGTIYHVITYFIFGILASSVFNYKELFTYPVISDYYRNFASFSNIAGPFVQIFRGIIISVSLLPFRNSIRQSKYGWLWLWFLFIAIGILCTPAAAPSSIEGVVYTKFPVWFHLIGLPEILLQTFAFSILLFNKMRPFKFLSSDLTKKLLSAFSTACFAFPGYAIISILFALVMKVPINSGSTNITVLGQFILPIVLIFVVNIISVKKILIVKHVFLYFLSAIALFLYQHFILGSAGLVYVAIAPVLPTIISVLISMTGKKSGSGNSK